LFFLFIPLKPSSQPSKYNIPTQRLLLQLGSGYLNVARQNQIDIDSGLALACNRTHLNRMIVISSQYEDLIRDPLNKWIVNEDIQSAKKLASASTGPKYIILLNQIGSFYAFQPSSRKNDFDSAMLYLAKAKLEAEANGNIKSLSQSLIYMGKCYLESGDITLASASFTKAINYAAKSGDQELEAMAWYFWGTYSPFQPNTIVERIDQIRKANLLFKKLGDTKNLIISFTNIGYLSFAAGKIDESMQSFLQAYAIEKSIGFPFTHYTADLIAVVASVKGDHETQLKYSMEAATTVEATKDSIALAYLYANRAHADMGYSPNTVEGLELGLKSLAEFKRLGGDPAMYMLTFNITDYLVKTGKSKEAIELLQDLINNYPPVSPIDRQEAYLSLAFAYEKNNPINAEKFYMAAEYLQKETIPIRGNLGAFHLYFNIGVFYCDERRYEKSREYLNKALMFGNDNEDGFALATVQRCLATIDSASGHFEDAYNHARKYNLLSDSIRTMSSNKQVNELRVRYETGKKVASINLLNQQTALQSAQISHDKLTKNVMIAGVGILILFVGLFYNRYRLKQRSNKQLESQQKEIAQKNTSLQELVEQKEWLLKEVHHRVKNNLQIIISLLNTQSNYLENEAAIKAIRESQERMNAISLIHQKLYKSDDSAFINTKEYVLELIENIGYGFSGTLGIVFDLNITNSQLDVAQAVPLGLILNEAISNIYKYAFPGKLAGTVNISINHLKDEREFLLIIRDNGIGLPIHYDITKKSSFGIRLMQGLSKQMGGSFKIENDNGVKITVEFSESKLTKLIRNKTTPFTKQYV
jgi:two-component sensor histidine kinase/Tfp pilus assembly protein PilF